MAGMLTPRARKVVPAAASVNAPVGRGGEGRLKENLATETRLFLGWVRVTRMYVVGGLTTTANSDLARCTGKQGEENVATVLSTTIERGQIRWHSPLQGNVFPILFFGR